MVLIEQSGEVHIAELTGDLALIMDFRGSERTIIGAKSPVERVVISSVAADGHSFGRFTCQLGIISALRASEAH
ncbi:hypothetical protein CRENPOLYSF2_1290004 [Crenothrix polyspora]|uniref:Uncharacterized protein n=2 Tax=Crenothrix polyspora TaxID=360316 RepID=A0A1R4H0H7_9GAMM|nr:hypothetical protein CRENPOLYSF2_1290004 [Crenothrix polyspora]